MLERNRVIVVGIDCGCEKGRKLISVGIPGLMVVEYCQHGVCGNYFLLAKLNGQIGTNQPHDQSIYGRDKRQALDRQRENLFQLISQGFRLQLPGFSDLYMQISNTRDRVLMKKVELVKAGTLGYLHQPETGKHNKYCHNAYDLIQAFLNGQIVI